MEVLKNRIKTHFSENVRNQPSARCRSPLKPIGLSLVSQMAARHNELVRPLAALFLGHVEQLRAPPRSVYRVRITSPN